MDASKPPVSGNFTHSIRFQLGIFYLILAILNIVFFSLMILEDQNELLRGKLNRTADNIVGTLRENLTTFPVLTRERDQALEDVKDYLVEQGARDFILFEPKGSVVQKVVDGKFVDLDPDAPESKVDEDIMKKSLEVGEQRSVLQKPFHTELDRDDFSLAHLLLPLKSKSGETLFLHTSLRLDEAERLLQRLYVQIGMAVGWGLIFFVLFAFLIYRNYIRRIEDLTDASHEMAAGQLSSRVNWKFNRKDEIDDMGHSFNNMATSIQDKIETITQLNEEINHELEIGREVQTNFLPEQAMADEFQACTYYRPMRSVSGDIYNFYRFPDNKKAVFLADASGHGPSAAIITGIAYTTLDRILMETVEPEEIIARLNGVLEDKLGTEFYMTVVFIVIDENRNIQYINAGHPPIFVVRPSTNELFELKPGNPPVGLVPDLPFSMESFQAQAGDRLITYSDAIYETANKAKEPFGLPRARENVLKNKDAPRQKIMDDLLEEFAAFIDIYDDDVTMIVMDL